VLWPAAIGRLLPHAKAVNSSETKRNQSVSPAWAVNISRISNDSIVAVLPCESVVGFACERLAGLLCECMAVLMRILT
jgi:hypothetical protein